MDTRIDEIDDRIYRISTFVPEIAEPAGFTFDQFLLDACELLSRTGMRHQFPAVSAAITTLIPLTRLRWITFGHIGLRGGDRCLGLGCGGGHVVLDMARIVGSEDR